MPGARADLQMEGRFCPGPHGGGHNPQLRRGQQKSLGISTCMATNTSQRSVSFYWDWVQLARQKGGGVGRSMGVLPLYPSLCPRHECLEFSGGFPTFIFVLNWVPNRAFSPGPIPPRIPFLCPLIPSMVDGGTIFTKENTRIKEVITGYNFSIFPPGSTKQF